MGRERGFALIEINFVGAFALDGPVDDEVVYLAVDARRLPIAHAYLQKAKAGPRPRASPDPALAVGYIQ